MADLKHCDVLTPHGPHDWQEPISSPAFSTTAYHHCRGVEYSGEGEMTAADLDRAYGPEVRRCPVQVPHEAHAWSGNYRCQGTTPAQETMRRELAEPMRLDKLLDEVVGETTLSVDGLIDARVRDTALAVIAEHPDLVLSLPVWGHVQAMVEEGIRRGVQLDRDFSG